MNRMSIRDRLREMMMRHQMSQRRSSSPDNRNVEMRARNDRISSPNQRPVSRPTMNRSSLGTSGGGPVPGLPGVHFGADFSQNMQTAARSRQMFDTGDKMSHPAVAFGRSMSGMDQGPGDFLKQATMDRLAAKGITHDDSGYTIAGVTRPRDPAGIYSPGKTVPSPGLGGVPQLGQSANANGGNIRLGNIPANTNLKIDVSGGTQIANGRTTTGNPGQATINGQPATASSLADSIRESVGIPRSAATGSSLADTIRSAVQSQIAGNQITPNKTTPAMAPAAAPAGPPAPPPGLGGVPAAAPSPPLTGGIAGMDIAAQQIITQETGGQDLTGQTNCTIRPGSGCLALNSGIFESTANEMGMDFNRIVNDPAYAAQAVNTLLSGYAADDASKWGGPAGMSVWDWGNQNLPGGGMEAVARVYFGGDVTGQYVDEQGRSGELYGQQFMEKMTNAGYDPATAQQPTPAGAAVGTPLGGEGGPPATPAPGGMTTGVFAPAPGGYDAGINPNAPNIRINPDGTATTTYPNPLEAGTYPNQPQVGMTNYMSQDARQNIAAPSPATGIGSPTGQIRTDVFGFGTGGDWANYNTYDPQFSQYGGQFGVDPAVLKGMSVVEGGGAAGTPDNGWGGGLMQVQPEWQAEADRLGLPPINTDEGQVAMAAAILGGQARLGTPANTPPGTIVGVEGDWKANFNQAFFPGGVETRTGSGVDAGTYLNAVDTLAGDIHAAQGPAAAPQQAGPMSPNNLGQPVQGVGMTPAPTGSVNGQPATGLHNTSVPQSIPTSLLQPNVQPPGTQPMAGHPQTGGMTLGKGGLPQINTPQQIPGNPATGQSPSIQDQRAGMLVGADATGQPPPKQMPPTTGTFDPNKTFPGSGGFIDPPGTGANRQIGDDTITTDPATGTTIDTRTGQTPPANGMPAPATVRPPKTTGTIVGTVTPTPDQMTGIAQGTAVQQGDGLGIYAGPEADESWVKTLNPASGGVNGDYKQYVCDGQSGGYYGQDGCCSGGDCAYDSTTKYFDPRSANQTVHPGYDIALPQGETFYAPVDAVVLGYGTYNDPANAVAGGPGCVSPGDGTSPAKTQINHCNWAYDNGLALGGWEDGDGSPIVISFDHIDPTFGPELVGQQVPAGTALAVGTYTHDAGHTHVEAHGFCAESGTNVILDPSLVMGGFYNTHSACEGITRPVADEPASTNGTTPGYIGTEAYNNLKAGYSQQQAPATDSQSYSAQQPYAPVSGGVDYTQQAAPAMPAPSEYAGSATPTTGQVVMDDATGQQYEIMADGSYRLIYDPSW